MPKQTFKFQHTTIFDWEGVMDRKIEVSATVKVNGGRYEMTGIVLPPELTSALFQFCEQEAERRLNPAESETPAQEVDHAN